MEDYAHLEQETVAARMARWQAWVAESDALAAEIQTEVDALLAANPGLNKVVLLAHMQQLNIERALAHVDGNAVRRAYARGEHWDERVRLADWWAGYLEELRAG